MTPREGELALTVLLARTGLLSKVTLVGGEVLEVREPTHGRDVGDLYDHLTTNIRPPRDGVSVAFFFTAEIRSIAAEDGEVLFTPTAVN